MAKKSKKGLYAKIRQIRRGEPTSVTYYFEDGSALCQQNINREILYKDVRGKEILRSPNEIIRVFETTMIDNGANYYILD